MSVNPVIDNAAIQQPDPPLPVQVPMKRGREPPDIEKGAVRVGQSKVPNINELITHFFSVDYPKPIYKNGNEFDLIDDNNVRLAICRLTTKINIVDSTYNQNCERELNLDIGIGESSDYTTRFRGRLTYGFKFSINQQKFINDQIKIMRYSPLQTGDLFTNETQINRPYALAYWLGFFTSLRTRLYLTRGDDKGNLRHDEILYWLRRVKINDERILFIDDGQVVNQQVGNQIINDDRQQQVDDQQQQLPRNVVEKDWPLCTAPEIFKGDVPWRADQDLQVRNNAFGTLQFRRMSEVFRGYNNNKLYIIIPNLSDQFSKDLFPALILWKLLMNFFKDNIKMRAAIEFEIVSAEVSEQNSELQITEQLIYEHLGTREKIEMAIQIWYNITKEMFDNNLGLLQYYITQGSCSNIRTHSYYSEGGILRKSVRLVEICRTTGMYIQNNCERHRTQLDLCSTRSGLIRAMCEFSTVMTIQTAFSVKGPLLLQYTTDQSKLDMYEDEIPDDSWDVINNQKVQLYNKGRPFVVKPNEQFNVSGILASHINDILVYDQLTKYLTMLYGTNSDLIIEMMKQSLRDKRTSINIWKLIPREYKQIPGARQGIQLDQEQLNSIKYQGVMILNRYHDPELAYTLALPTNGIDPLMRKRTKVNLIDSLQKWLDGTDGRNLPELELMQQRKLSSKMYLDIQRDKRLAILPQIMMLDGRNIQITQKSRVHKLLQSWNTYGGISKPYQSFVNGYYGFTIKPKNQDFNYDIEYEIDVDCPFEFYSRSYQGPRIGHHDTKRQDGNQSQVQVPSSLTDVREDLGQLQH